MRDRRCPQDEPWNTRPQPLKDGLPWEQAVPNQPESTTTEQPNTPSCGPAAPLLDPDEIPHQHTHEQLPPPATLPESYSLSFRHRSWAVLRKRIYAGMIAAQLPSARLSRFAACGSQTWIEAQRRLPERPQPGFPDPFQAARLRCNCCRDRFCTPCAATRARVLARSLIALLDGHTARFITLTLRSTDQPLTDQIDHLYASYRSLRKTRLWTANVTAAAAMLEITRNKATGRWHPHLHVLAEGRFIPHADLRHAWTTASGGSFICDIRMVKDLAKAASYVAKYVSKPMVATYASSIDAIAEALSALRHRRMVLLTGAWHAVTDEEPPDDGLWEVVGYLSDIVSAADAADPTALELLTLLWSDGQWKQHLPPRSPPPDPSFLTAPAADTY